MGIFVFVDDKFMSSYRIMLLPPNNTYKWKFKGRLLPKVCDKTGEGGLGAGERR